jgi:AraC-like DNA-binding protein
MIAQFEQLRTTPAVCFNAFILRKDRFDVPLHFHPEYELTYILSSSGTRYVGNSFEEFEENDMVLIGPNLPHCWKNSDPDAQQANAIVVHWDAELIDKRWLEMTAFSEIAQLLALAARGVKFGRSAAGKIRRQLRTLTTLRDFERFHYFLKILHELSQCGDMRALVMGEDVTRLNYANNERIGVVLEYIRENYAQKITLSQVANEVKMTEEGFSRFFSRVMRKTFVSYLNEYRINRACTMLTETDKQVAAICYESGYDTQPFFFKQFRKFKNCSPGEYRGNYQSEIRLILHGGRQ